MTVGEALALLEVELEDADMTDPEAVLKGVIDDAEADDEAEADADELAMAEEEDADELATALFWLTAGVAEGVGSTVEVESVSSIESVGVAMASIEFWVIESSIEDPSSVMVE